MGQILIPVDFSENSLQAAKYGLRLAHALGHTPHLLHIFQLNVKTVFQSQEDLDQLERKTHQETDNKLVEFVNRALAELNQPELQELDTHVSCDVGYPMERLLELMEQIQPDFVVMGTHGASKLRDRLLGSNTAHVIQHAPYPLIALHNDASLELPERGILTANLPKLSNASLGNMQQAATTLQLQLSLLHVDAAGDSLHPAVIPQEEENRLKQIGLNAPLVNLKPGSTLLDALTTTLEQEEAQMILLCQEDKKLFNLIFQPSIFRFTSFHTRLPILVMPPAKRS